MYIDVRIWCLCEGLDASVGGWIGCFCSNEDAYFVQKNDREAAIFKIEFWLFAE